MLRGSSARLQRHCRLCRRLDVRLTGGMQGDGSGRDDEEGDQVGGSGLRIRDPAGQLALLDFLRGLPEKEIGRGPRAACCKRIPRLKSFEMVSETCEQDGITLAELERTTILPTRR